MTKWWWWWWWWWWWIVFVVWLTSERCLALFPPGTIVKDPHLTIRNPWHAASRIEPARNQSSGLVELISNKLWFILRWNLAVFVFLWYLFWQLGLLLMHVLCQVLCHFTCFSILCCRLTFHPCYLLDCSNFLVYLLYQY